MANKKIKIMLSIMKELEKRNEPDWVVPTCDDYGIDYEEFGNIVEMCVNAGYIKDATVQRAGSDNTVTVVWLDQARITLEGMRYLEENSFLTKTYRGLKELREWL